MSIALAGLKAARPWPPRRDHEGAVEGAALARSLVAVGVDDGNATADAVRAVVAVLPSDDVCARAAALARRAADDGLKLTKTTRFALAVHAWGRDRLATFLEAAAFCAEAPADLDAAAAAAKVAAEACALAREDKQLRASLHAALHVGNRLNRGSRRENAVAVSLVQLERLDHTKGTLGRTPFDLLAQILEFDAEERGTADALDGAAVDASLRAIGPKLLEGAALALPERTTDVAADVQKKLRALRAFLADADRDDAPPATGDDADDLAVAAFCRRAAADADNVAEKLAEAKALMGALKDEQDKLRDYVSEADLPVPVILESMAAFAKKLVEARERMLDSM